LKGLKDYKIVWNMPSVYQVEKQLNICFLGPSQEYDLYDNIRDLHTSVVDSFI